MHKIRIFNSNAIKLLAAFFMVIDHVGFFFFPHLIIFRILGRISFPLFAYALAEGCRYTKNKAAHFALLFSVAVLCQVVYYFFDDGNLEMSVLVTFSLSAILIYSLQYFKKRLFAPEVSPVEKITSGTLFVSLVIAVYLLCNTFVVDYGFWGCLLPVFVSLFDLKEVPMPAWKAKFDNQYVRILCLAAGLCFLSLKSTGTGIYANIQWYSLLSLPILLLYNGEKGKWNLKYFFYAFYPLHLVLLQGIYTLIYLL